MCENHRVGIPISVQAVEQLRLILGGHLGEALNHQESLVTKEVEKIATEALEFFLERRIRTTRLLDN
ncbi:MAG: hypothetical protein VYB80_05120 [Actinomycetota bacterium]|nr:hypothetical protein [Actinomycetota bacterium]